MCRSIGRCGSGREGTLQHANQIQFGDPQKRLNLPWPQLRERIRVTLIISGGQLGLCCRRLKTSHSNLALDRKKLAAFSALGGGFLRFPIGDRRCNRTRVSVGNAGGNARPSLTNATLAASRLLRLSARTA